VKRLSVVLHLLLSRPVQVRRTGNPEHVPAVVIGIVERFVEPDLRIKLKDADDDLRLIEDLGIDSLTMMEIVILVEDVLQSRLTTMSSGICAPWVTLKPSSIVRSVVWSLPKPTKFLPIEHIVAVMPIQPPFLFLNEGFG